MEKEKVIQIATSESENDSTLLALTNTGRVFVGNLVWSGSLNKTIATWTEVVGPLCSGTKFLSNAKPLEPSQDLI